MVSRTESQPTYSYREDPFELAHGSKSRAPDRRLEDAGSLTTRIWLRKLANLPIICCDINVWSQTIPDPVSQLLAMESAESLQGSHGLSIIRRRNPLQKEQCISTHSVANSSERPLADALTSGVEPFAPVELASLSPEPCPLPYGVRPGGHRRVTPLIREMTMPRVLSDSSLTEYLNSLYSPLNNMGSYCIDEVRGDSRSASNAAYRRDSSTLIPQRSDRNRALNSGSAEPGDPQRERR